jgi:hypothetical protein
MSDIDIRLGLKPAWTGPLAAAATTAAAFAAVKRRHARGALTVAATLAVLSVGAWYDFEFVFQRVAIDKKK